MCLAIPGGVVDISSDQLKTAVIEVVGCNEDLGLLQHNPPVAGDWVLIHVGFAMNKISEDDAVETLRTLGEPEAAMQEVTEYRPEEQS